MSSEKWLSVVIPVYNSAEYLREALDSIAEQFVPVMEIVIVDDGSTDESPKIIDEYRDAIDVKAIRQENRGLGEARNSGLRVATGTYVYFLDSDDRLAPNVLSEMKRLLTSSDKPPDVVLFDGASFLDSRNRGSKDYWPDYSRGVEIGGVDGPYLLTKLIQMGTNFASALGYISRRSLWNENGILFPSIIHEDENVFLDLMLAAEDVSCVQLVVFERRVRADSIMTQEVTEKHLAGRFACLSHALELLRGRRRFDGSLVAALERQALNLLVAYLDSVYKMRKNPDILILLKFMRFVRSPEKRARCAVRVFESYQRNGLRALGLNLSSHDHSSLRR